MIRIGSSLWLTVFPLVLFASGCLISPYALENFATTATAIPFEGCSLSANSPIQINTVYWPGEKPPVLIPLGSTTSSGSVSYTDSTGLNWYCWRVNVTVPEQYWWFTNPSDGFATVVKVTDGGDPLWTYANDPTQCTQAWGAAQLTDSAPCALSPPHSEDSDGTNDILAGDILITATARPPH
jgi:hypothetical protein